jgi:hypothetical protein
LPKTQPEIRLVGFELFKRMNYPPVIQGETSSEIIVSLFIALPETVIVIGSIRQVYFLFVFYQGMSIMKWRCK